MNQTVYDKIAMVDIRLARKYECLPMRLYKELDVGLLDSINACESMGIMPSVDALREIIDDGLKGQFHFKDNLTDRSKR